MKIVVIGGTGLIGSKSVASEHICVERAEAYGYVNTDRKAPRQTPMTIARG